MVSPVASSTANIATATLPKGSLVDTEGRPASSSEMAEAGGSTIR